MPVDGLVKRVKVEAVALREKFAVIQSKCI